MRLTVTLRETFIAWALRVRPPEPVPVVLGQRRVYVLPTRAGLGYAAALLVMLLGAINYNLSLGYVLTFLLAGLGVTAILHTFRNLVRLTITPGRAPAVFAGDTASFHLTLRGVGGPVDRRAIRLWLPGGEDTVVDVAGGDSTDARLRLATDRRGWRILPTIGLETTYPLGLVRAWAYCAPDFRCLVYPQPSATAPPLPYDAGETGERHGGGARQGRLRRPARPSASRPASPRRLENCRPARPRRATIDQAVRRCRQRPPVAGLAIARRPQRRSAVVHSGALGAGRRRRRARLGASPAGHDPVAGPRPGPSARGAERAGALRP